MGVGPGLDGEWKRWISWALTRARTNPCCEGRGSSLTLLLLESFRAGHSTGDSKRGLVVSWMRAVGSIHGHAPGHVP